MSSNLPYGGIVYPDSPFVFDTIYKNLKEAEEKVNTDNILVGRYILIAYCSTAFGKDERNEIEGNWSTIQATASDEQKAYRKNYETDGHKSNDRKVFRKSFSGTTYTYEEITSLHTDLSDESIAVLGIQSNDKVLAVNKDRTLSSTLGLKYNERGGQIELVGINNTIIASIPTTDFIADGVFQRIEINDQENTLTFYWTNYNIENNTTTEKSQTVKLYDIIDPYKSGDGIIVASIPNENPTIAIKRDNTSENFLSVSSNGLKLSGVQTAIDTAKQQAVDIVTEDIEKRLTWTSF